MERKTYIYGVGDEVLQFAGFCLFLIPLLVLIVWRCTQRNRSPVSTVPEVVHYRNTDLQRDLQHQGRGPSEVPPTRQRREEDLCPICISAVHLPCEACCGHLFCTACLHGYWLNRGQRGTLPCPCCRRPITLLLAAFPDHDSEEARGALHHLSAYNAATAQRTLSLSRLLWEIPLLVRRILSEPFAAYCALFSVRVLLMLVATAVYVLSPLDLLPDGLLGPIGLIDDVLVLLGMGLLGLESFRQHLLRAQQQH
eukprot:GGOE01041744.1.p1 GENE.GGOE01041744.1~~GGOE01041744.1.p1  ORF type:complete len:272 (-),score=60.47 GGOE01041744.1:234-992(-)